jgi:large subunit ribosomal protein L18
VSKITLKKAKVRARRKKHIRKVVFGTAERPRLVVYRSLTHIYAQLVDDDSGKTILGVSSLTQGVKEQIAKMKKSEVSTAVGSACAAKALEQNINTIVFDRNGFPYHGRVKALAEGLRKGGLKF